jgi:hypothetical protein
MIKKLFLLSSSIFLALTSHGQPTNRLHFPTTGFSIAPLEAPPGESPQQALMMFLPVMDGFSANVNVQIQPYVGAIDEYLALSLQQFKTAGLKLLQQKTPGKSVAVFEYTGEVKGRLLHWYARAEKSAGKVYLVTAAAPDEQWSRVADKLKACVDSFRCDSGEQGAAPNTAPTRR